MKNTLLFVIIIISLISCKKPQPVKKSKIAKSPIFERAISFVDKDNDSAFYYFNKVATSTKDSLLAAKSYYYMAYLQNTAGDTFGAQESALTSLKFLNEKNPDHFSCLSSDYNELGSTSLNLKHYNEAINYYEAAGRYTDDENNKITNANNLAQVYQEQGNYAKAIRIYTEILPKSRADRNGYARVLTNLAYTKWLQNPEYKAEKDLIEALKIREADDSEWGMNSSYAHLADYYTGKKNSSALYYALKMQQIATVLKSPDDRLEALRKLIKLSPQKQTTQYLNNYVTLSDSLQTTRNASKNQFALIRYESEKSKSENLQLQKDNTVKKYQIVTREFLIMGIVALFAGATVFSVIWFKRRKRRMETEAQIALRDSQLKTSKKVHDVVANGLYRVMTEIGNQKSVDKELILDKIEDLYEKSRDISYENSDSSGKSFNEVVSELLTSFATEDTKILIAGNNKKLWENLSESVKYELEQVLQELMVNMKKHSQATNVGVKFENQEDRIIISYTDNGVGMPDGVQGKNGRRNTGNRMTAIGGEIIFETEVEKGLKIQLSFPVS